MASQPQREGLDVEQDLRYQGWEWLVQRIGWALMALFILAAVLGLVAEGPLTKKRVAAADGSLVLEYGAVLHHHNSTELRIQIAKDAATANELRLWISSDYLEALAIKTITPAPLRTEAGPSGHTLVFPLAHAGAGATITFHFEPNEIGSISGQVQVQDKEAVSVWHFVLP